MIILSKIQHDIYNHYNNLHVSGVKKTIRTITLAKAQTIKNSRKNVKSVEKSNFTKNKLIITPTLLMNVYDEISYLGYTIIYSASL